jgi:hypothetical protein
MPFDTRLVAIERWFGKYSVHSQFENAQLQELNSRKRLCDVSTNAGSRDFAGVFTRDQVIQSGADVRTSAWLASLSPETLIMVVLEEWESGL